MLTGDGAGQTESGLNVQRDVIEGYPVSGCLNRVITVNELYSGRFTRECIRVTEEEDDDDAEDEN